MGRMLRQAVSDCGRTAVAIVLIHCRGQLGAPRIAPAFIWFVGARRYSSVQLLQSAKINTSWSE